MKNVSIVREELLTLDLFTALREELVDREGGVGVVGGVIVGDGAAGDAQGSANFNVD